MKITVLGAGAWGTAVAINAATRPETRHEVTLWSRDAAHARQMQQERVNTQFLPDVALPRHLNIVSGDCRDAARGSTLTIIATPMAALREMLLALHDCGVPVAWLSKGFEQAQPDAAHGLLGHEICAQCAPGLSSGAYSGPSFAQEVAAGKPTALVAASQDAALRQLMQQALHSQALRIYTSEDLTGVQTGGAVKNVLAIATGLCDGMQLGLNARAALITRGLAEITRFGVALGAHAETFMGLSGMGDLVLTSTGDLSRNRKVGLLLAQGCSLQEAVDSLGHVAEGVYCARTVADRARAIGVEMPITEAVVNLLDGRITAQQALAHLMEREPRAE